MAKTRTALTKTERLLAEVSRVDQIAGRYGMTVEDLDAVCSRIGAHEALRDALYALRRNVDVSTIRPGKRNEARWAELIEKADAALNAAT